MLARDAVVVTLLVAVAACGSDSTASNTEPGPITDPGPVTEIVVANDTRPGRVSVASDGTGFLVAYYDDESLGVRVSADGDLLDDEPIRLTEHPPCLSPDPPDEIDLPFPSVTFANGSYHVLWRADSPNRGSRTMYKAVEDDECPVEVRRPTSSGGCGGFRLTGQVSGAPFGRSLAIASYGRTGCGLGDVVFLDTLGGFSDFPARPWRQPPFVASSAALASTGLLALATWWDRPIGNETERTELRVAIRAALRPLRESTVATTGLSPASSTGLDPPSAAATMAQFLVAWVDDGNDLDIVRASRVTPGADVLDIEGSLVVAQYDGEIQHVVLAGNDDHYLVGWTETDADGRTDLRAVFVDTSGAIVEPGAQTLAEDVVGSIATAGNEQQFLVAFMRRHAEPDEGVSVYARRVAAP